MYPDIHSLTLLHFIYLKIPLQENSHSYVDYPAFFIERWQLFPFIMFDLFNEDKNIREMLTWIKLLNSSLVLYHYFVSYIYV